jgi:hypothetical protein
VSDLPIFFLSKNDEFLDDQIRKYDAIAYNFGYPRCFEMKTCFTCPKNMSKKRRRSIACNKKVVSLQSPITLLIVGVITFLIVVSLQSFGSLITLLL